MSVRENDLAMMLDLITEYESLMFWMRTAGSPTIMISCERAQDAESAGEWAGQVSEIKTTVKKGMVSVTDKVEHRIEKLEKKVESQMNKMKESTDKRMKGIEGKLEAIIGLLNSRS
jgi:LPS O-antigen subunit length determinant protein (WzzB/FepE family)